MVLAAVKPEEIYSNGTGSKAFKRCASRLNEVTSQDYFTSVVSKN